MQIIHVIQCVGAVFISGKRQELVLKRLYAAAQLPKTTRKFGDSDVFFIVSFFQIGK